MRGCLSNGPWGSKACWMCECKDALCVCLCLSTVDTDVCFSEGCTKTSVSPSLCNFEKSGKIVFDSPSRAAEFRSSAQLGVRGRDGRCVCVCTHTHKLSSNFPFWILSHWSAGSHFVILSPSATIRVSRVGMVGFRMKANK